MSQLVPSNYWRGVDVLLPLCEPFTGNNTSRALYPVDNNKSAMYPHNIFGASYFSLNFNTQAHEITQLSKGQ